MTQNTLDAKGLEIAHEAAEAAYLAEEHEGLAFDGAVTAGIRAYLAALREDPVPSEEPVAFITEKLDGSKRSVMLASKYDPRRADFWVSDAARQEHRVTPLFASPAVAPVASVKEALDEALGLARLAATLTGCRGDDDYVAGVQAKIEVALSSIIPEDELPVWHVGSWGDGSTPPYLANIFCDAHEATIAAGILKEHAVAIVDAHNEALAALREAARKALEDAFEQCAVIAEIDMRSPTAKAIGHKPEWYKHGLSIAKRIRIAARALAEGETK